MPGHPLPERVDDLPPCGGADEMEVLVVDGRAGDRRGDVAEDVDDLDLDQAVGDVSRPADAFGCPRDHLGRRECPERLFGHVVHTPRPLRELRMECPFHPRGVAVEPALEVVEDGALDRARRLDLVTRRRHGLASKTRLNGVSATRRKRVKPPLFTTTRMPPTPACAPSASPTS